MFIFTPEGRPNYEKYCYYANHFDAAECDAIEAIAAKLPEEMGKIGSQTGNEASPSRKSTVKWIHYNAEVDWLFRKLMSVTQDANRARYGFELSGFLEALQHTRYRSAEKAEGADEFYDWHEDIGPHEMAKRKLSLVVQLSEPSDYEGGVLEVFGVNAPLATRGTVVVFPAYVIHRVTPVTKGERRSLVTWTSGPPFR